eukprot:11540226-Alexandrium_andersonii.AAC.1
MAGGCRFPFADPLGDGEEGPGATPCRSVRCLLVKGTREGQFARNDVGPAVVCQGRNGACG